MDSAKEEIKNHRTTVDPAVQILVWVETICYNIVSTQPPVVENLLAE